MCLFPLLDRSHATPISVYFYGFGSFLALSLFPRIAYQFMNGVCEKDANLVKRELGL